jgi:hypothetical protein
MQFRVLCAIGAISAAAFLPEAARALTVTHEECAEGADFIRNAALSRDNGLKSHEFLDRLEADLVAIRSVPEALRWFVRDDDDADLLRRAVVVVFADPQGADSHHREFLSSCRATVAGLGVTPRIATR